MRVVLSYIHYPVAMGSYFRAALKRRNDIELITAGPYTGTSIPWGGGMNLPAKYAIPPDVILPHTAGSNPIPIQMAEASLPSGWKPDVWLQIDAGFYFQGKPTYGKNFIVATDPHVLAYDNQRWLADKFFCMQTPYMQAGDEYLPYGYDPLWHRPEEQPRNYDACLIGLHYPQRDALVKALRDKGIVVYYGLGPCFDEARALYNQAPIGLNWSSLKDLTARVFELTAMGRVAVVNRVPDLSRFFVDQRDVLAFDSLEEAVNLVAWALDHRVDAAAIAEAGRQAVGPHSWDARIEQILKAV